MYTIENVPNIQPAATQEQAIQQLPVEPLAQETFDPPVVEDQDTNGDEMQMEFDPRDDGDEGLCKVGNSRVLDS